MTARVRRAVLLLTLLPGAAAAQWGGSVLVETDQRFRGVSLSDGGPSARLTLSYDHADGAYAGLSATRYRFAEGSARASLLGYAGYSAAATPAWRWELGLTYTAVEHDSGDPLRYDYGEVYAGLLGERVGLRLYASPHYFGGEPSVYLELSANWPLASNWQLVAHLGALGSRDDGSRADARLGLVWRWGGLDLQLAWAGAQDGGPPPRAYGSERHTVLLGAVYSF